MSSFLNNICLCQLGMTDNTVITEPFVYYNHKLKTIILIKKCFVTDLCSVPSRLRGSINDKNRYFRAWTVHDAFWRCGKEYRELGNEALDHCLSILGMGWWYRSKVSFGLFFGSPTHNKQQLANAKKYVKIVEIKEDITEDEIKIKAEKMLKRYLKSKPYLNTDIDKVIQEFSA